MGRRRTLGKGSGRSGSCFAISSALQYPRGVIEGVVITTSPFSFVLRSTSTRRHTKTEWTSNSQGRSTDLTKSQTNSSTFLSVTRIDTLLPIEEPVKHKEQKFFAWGRVVTDWDWSVSMQDRP